MKYRFFSFFLILCLLLPLTGCTSIFANSIDDYTKKKMQPITLNYWRVWDGPDDFGQIIAYYNSLHPNITINYRKLRYEEYEQALIEAFAVDRGPDILSIHNTWVKGYQDKGLLAPMPAQTTMVFPQVQGKLKKEVIYTKKSDTSPTLNQMKNDFVDVIYNDVVISAKDEKTGVMRPQVFGLPLAIDTLAMFYNKDLFNNAGITSPPEYWNRKFQEDVKKLTKQNNKGEIIQSGVALGGSYNVERSTDILSALMMQNGALMMQNGKVSFQYQPSAFEGKNYNPGADALRFYTDFANPAKEVYSWNDQLENSIELFAANKLAIMFGYSYMLPDIKAKAPKLNFSLAKLPQIEGNPQSVNYANYWVEAVSNKSKYKEEAWDFIKYMTTKDKIVKTYLDKTGKPTARRSLVDTQIDENEFFSPFVEQILTAKSWYNGNDANTAEVVMKDMIDRVVKGQGGISDNMELAAKKIQQTIGGN